MTKEINFYKYQGAGNDFILIDNRNLDFDRENYDLVNRLCDRRFGIGADGLMLLEKKNNFDFQMVYYNADGKEGSMCGNGGRCIVAFARDLGIIKSNTVFLAVDGPHQASIEGNEVKLGMIDVPDHKRDERAYVLQTGSPHFVQFADHLADMDVFKAGSAIRNNQTYAAEGINVNFVQEENDGYFVRTFERGVEDETFACGTGAVASAMAIALANNLEGDQVIPIRVMGGQLQISFHKQGNQFTDVYLSGPATQVFQGKIKISY